MRTSPRRWSATPGPTGSPAPGPRATAIDSPTASRPRSSGARPGSELAIRNRHVLTPVSLEALDANLKGGAVNGGTSAIRQQLFLRPVPDWSGGERTPIDGLYLASASAHPGGGVHGACGANAAHTALRIHGD